MSVQAWEQVKELLHQAMQLAPEQRAPFLDKACSSDRALRAEVESLLLAGEGFTTNRPNNLEKSVHRFLAEAIQASPIGVHKADPRANPLHLLRSLRSPGCLDLEV
jgi:hypothetical protein